MSDKAIIEIRSISFTYPNASRKVLDRCSLDIHKGELISILGPNGAGKSTLLNCACGLFSPQSGSILVNGVSIDKMSQRDIAKVIGFVRQSQNPSFPYTVFDYVLMGRASSIGLFQKPTKHDIYCVQETLENMGIFHLANAAVTEISGGERQQAAIARAIVQKPEVIFFDEPTSHLDYGNQIKTLQRIDNLREEGFSIVMTTHIPDHCIMLGGIVAVINCLGQLVCGEWDEMITEDQLIQLYNVDLSVMFIDRVGRYVCIPENLKKHPLKEDGCCNG